MNHLTSDQLQEYADGLAENPEYQLHIRSCPACRADLKTFRELDRALRRIPLERVSSDFTGQLMSRLGVKESASFAWTILKNAAPFLASPSCLVFSSPSFN